MLLTQYHLLHRKGEVYFYHAIRLMGSLKVQKESLFAMVREGFRPVFLYHSGARYDIIGMTLPSETRMYRGEYRHDFYPK